MNRRTREQRADNPFAGGNIFSGTHRNMTALRLMDLRTRRVAHQYYPNDVASVMAARHVFEATGKDMFYYAEGKSNIDYDTVDVLIDGEQVFKISCDWLTECATITDIEELSKRSRLILKALRQAQAQPDAERPVLINDKGNVTELGAKDK